MLLLATAIVGLSACTVGDPSRIIAAEPSATITAAAPLAQEVSAGSIDRVITTSEGKERSYLVSTPPGYDSTRSWPVILAFHGWGQDAQSMRDATQLDKARAIVVFADGIDKAWAPAPYAKSSGKEDLGFVRTIISEVDKRFNVDHRRIFAAGFSNGGGFAAYLSCQMPDQVTAIAPVGAAYYTAILKDCSHTPVAWLDIHGTHDQTINYYGGRRHDTDYESVPEVLSEVAKRNGCEEPVIVRRSTTEIEQHWQGCEMPLSHLRVGGGEHVWPDGATAEVRSFFGV
ncbi:hypothetical protein GCM10027031_25030 [Corynebacterium atrinae]